MKKKKLAKRIAALEREAQERRRDPKKLDDAVIDRLNQNAANRDIGAVFQPQNASRDQ